MPIAPSNGIEIAYETFGHPDDPTLLLIMGLGASLTGWPDDLCEAFVDRGFHVVRFDNRDVGGSTWVDADADELMAALGAIVSGEAEPPYRLADMAADTAGLLDHLGVGAAHVMGVSMGGMIAQQLVLDQPHRVLTLTSIMSTTGDPDVGHPRPEVLGNLVRPPAATRDEFIESAVATSRLIGSPDHFEEDRQRARHAAHYDRGYNPHAQLRQVCAVAASPARTEALRSVTVPTLVMHGDADPLIDISGGRRTAEAIPGAEFVVLEGMGHDLPSAFWATIVEHVTALAARVAA